MSSDSIVQWRSDYHVIRDVSWAGRLPRHNQDAESRIRRHPAAHSRSNLQPDGVWPNGAPQPQNALAADAQPGLQLELIILILGPSGAKSGLHAHRSLESADRQGALDAVPTHRYRPQWRSL